MKMYDLIFSNKRSPRIKRHVIFWTAFYLYQVLRMSFLFPPNHIWDGAPIILLSSLVWGLFHVMLITYTVTYYLIPKFFVRKKYILFGLCILGLFVAMFWYDFFYVMLVKKFTHAIGTTKEQPYIFLRGTIIRLFGNAPLVCGLFISFKTLKNWYQKQLENDTLIKEKANAELQLLKAQIHPHFLFNTLNNIYSYTLTRSPFAAELVQKLSDMLNYMITDCNRVSVPLEKEIQLLKDYIGLEKVRYGNRLDIQMHINGDRNGKMIAPLLMIPFVENCFKHGASVMRGKQWMHLIINVTDEHLDFNLSNSKPAIQDINKSKSGIGLINVQKRLALLYTGNYELDINSTDNTFSVYLKINLQKPITHDTEKKSNHIPIQQEFETIINY